MLSEAKHLYYNERDPHLHCDEHAVPAYVSVAWERFLRVT